MVNRLKKSSEDSLFHFMAGNGGRSSYQGTLALLGVITLPLSMLARGVKCYFLPKKSPFSFCRAYVGFAFLGGARVKLAFLFFFKSRQNRFDLLELFHYSHNYLNVTMYHFDLP